LKLTHTNACTAGPRPHSSPTSGHTLATTGPQGKCKTDDTPHPTHTQHSSPPSRRKSLSRPHRRPRCCCHRRCCQLPLLQPAPANNSRAHAPAAAARCLQPHEPHEQPPAATPLQPKRMHAQQLVPARPGASGRVLCQSARTACSTPATTSSMASAATSCCHVSCRLQRTRHARSPNVANLLHPFHVSDTE
jgi:hypothetical protein